MKLIIKIQQLPELNILTVPSTLTIPSNSNLLAHRPHTFLHGNTHKHQVAYTHGVSLLIQSCLRPLIYNNRAIGIAAFEFKWLINFIRMTTTGDRSGDVLID